MDNFRAKTWTCPRLRAVENESQTAAKFVDSLTTDTTSSVEEYGALLGGSHAMVEKLCVHIPSTPEDVIDANERDMKQFLQVLASESWSYRRHAEKDILSLCGSYKILQRFKTMIAGALEIGCAVLEQAAADPVETVEDDQQAT